MVIEESVKNQTIRVLKREWIGNDYVQSLGKVANVCINTPLEHILIEAGAVELLIKNGLCPQIRERNDSPTGLLTKFAPASGPLPTLFPLPGTHIFSRLVLRVFANKAPP